MLRRLAIFVFTLCSIMAAAQIPADIVPMQQTYSLTGATATGPGTAFHLKVQQPNAQPPNRFTFEVIATGGPGAVSLNLEGSIDLQTSTVGAVTSGSTTFTCATCNFAAATDTGKEITIVGAGAAGATLVTTISTVTNATTVTLGGAASTTVTNATTRWANWFTLDTSTTTTKEMRHVVNKPVLWIRANLATLTGGASPTVSVIFLSAAN
jgi:hypothetical protein